MACTKMDYSSDIISDMPDWEMLTKKRIIDDDSSSIASDWSIIGDEHFHDEQTTAEHTLPSSVLTDPVDLEPSLEEPADQESHIVPDDYVEASISLTNQESHNLESVPHVQTRRMTSHSSTASIRQQRQVNKKDISHATQIRNNKAVHAARLANVKKVKQQYRGAMLSHASQRSQNKSCHK